MRHANKAIICHGSDSGRSFSTHHAGTCSGHGGVRQWLTNQGAGRPDTDLARYAEGASHWSGFVSMR
ncbi:hypothetical protein BST27_10620 [Mycobacterium intermedium]|uniref:DUF3761 domain-containing protein n=1 Tax=Mycobacterium intermedium TaxID=28445 RepID=A0A1T3VUY9_MYCIE|nr:DUF3761 domain-containing protein [Mycobacterium intermedium]OPE45600.1 hypothetical protein BV508_29060 [Mycobacterium intermedium]ORB06853.1 hypothetical protein BST27_10620 [Mycobacterium intermedium]